MILTRRRVLTAGGGFLAGVALLPMASLAADVLDIVMTGRPDGSEVWFDPIGLHVMPGQSVRWTNRDLGNSHTATAYHPDLFGRPQRIPVGAEPWDSDYLLPDESFVITLTIPGVYDYYCVPHEHAGMVGRIVVGDPVTHGPAAAPAEDMTPLPQAALAAFPSVADILSAGRVRPKQADTGA